MKINTDVKTSPINTFAESTQTESRKNATAEPNRHVDPSDKVELSDTSRDVGKVITKANAAPSVRQNKVDSIREAIQNGTYKVDSSFVAKAILKNNLLDEVL